MIYLKKVTNSNIFKEYPQLTTIWPKTSSDMMQESVQDFFNFYEQNSSTFDLGNIYTIFKDDNIVGITGLLVLHGESNSVYSYTYNQQYLKQIHLRWHGVLYEYRGQNIAIDALKLILLESQKLYPNVLEVIERVPNSPNGNISKHFFEKIGFKEFGEVDTFEGSEYEWQPMIANIQDILKYTPKSFKKMKLK